MSEFAAWGCAERTGMISVTVCVFLNAIRSLGHESERQRGEKWAISAFSLRQHFFGFNSSRFEQASERRRGWDYSERRRK